MTTFTSTGAVNQSITRVGAYEPFELQVARSQITGHSTVSIFGYQTAIPTSGFIPVWENATTYTYPTSALTMTYASTSSETLTMTVTGLDINYNQVSDTVTFAGSTSGTATNGTAFFRINSITVTAIGTFGASNVGTITAKNAGTTYAQINPSVGRSQSAIYTVPAGNTFYLKRTQGWTNMVYTSGSYGTYRTWTVNAAGVNGIVTQRPFVANFVSERWYPNIYAAKTDIQWQMSATGTAYAAGFVAEGVLVANDGTL